jgi:hypothetical protein
MGLTIGENDRGEIAVEWELMIEKNPYSLLRAALV